MSSATLKARVAEALVRHIAPALSMDGTQVEVLDVDNGVARIRLGGVCGSCPSSIMAAVMGIEEELRKHVPEIDYVELSRDTLPMRFGYNTNGFAHHRFEDALEIIAELGYESVALTLDYHTLDPFAPDLLGRTAALRKRLNRFEFRSVIETGARFLLDPRRKHWPTLLCADSADVETRLDFLRDAIDIAFELRSDAVSFWSGISEMRGDEAETLGILAERCRELSDWASKKGVRLAFEPEPGMFIDTMAKFAKLHALVNRPNFGLTLDVGHLHCQDEGPIADYIRQWSHCLWNVHIEDMRRGVHDHLMFGEGEMDFPPILAALKEVGYAGGVHVELSRHSHDAVRTAERALAFLRSANA